MIKSIVSASSITHWIAAGLAAAVAFASSPAGIAIVTQYPKLTAVVTLLSLLAALYHIPSKNS